MDMVSYLLGKKRGGGGIPISQVINTTVTHGLSSSGSGMWYNNLFVLEGIKNLTFTLDPDAQDGSSYFSYLFGGCKWEYMPKFVSNGEITNMELQSAFNGCSNLKELDFGGVIGTVKKMPSCFNGCSSLTKLDIRGLVMSTIATSSSYQYAFNSIPDDCLIIVKNDTEKTWLTGKWANLTNVKTVAEYESE